MLNTTCIMYRDDDKYISRANLIDIKRNVQRAERSKYEILVLLQELCVVTLNGSKMQKNTSFSDDFMRHFSFHFIRE